MGKKTTPCISFQASGYKKINLWFLEKPSEITDDPE